MHDRSVMDPRDQLVVDQLERAVNVFERLAADVHLMRADFLAVADRLAALDASVDTLVLASSKQRRRGE